MEKKKRCLSLKQKLDLITDFERNGKKQVVLAKEYRIVKSSVSTILKKREEIKRQCYGGQINVNRKRARKAKHNDLDELLFKWFTYARTSNLSISGPMLINKANQIAIELGKAGWKCNEGWMDRFKKRHSIILRKTKSDRNVNHNISVDKGQDTVSSTVLSQYHPKDVYNAQEIGLFWRLMPDETLSHRGEECLSGNKSRERITVLICANMDGSDKRPLYVIGKFQNPRAFKGLKTLPVRYDCNNKAWMTDKLFTSWVHEFDTAMAAQQRKVLLMVDDCAAHPKDLNLRATEVVCLPKDMVMNSQPCDMGLIRSLKAHYRFALLTKVFSHLDNGFKYEDFSLSLLDAVRLIWAAWEKVSEDKIKNSYWKAGFTRIINFIKTEENEDPTEEHNMCSDTQLLPLLTRLEDEMDLSLSVEDLVNVDDNVTVSSPPADVAVNIQSSVENESMTSDEEDDGSSLPLVTPAEAQKCVETLSLYLFQAGCGDNVTSSFGSFQCAFEQFQTQKLNGTRISSLFKF